MNARFICEISHNLSRAIDFLKHLCDEVAKYLTNFQQLCRFCHSPKMTYEYFHKKIFGEKMSVEVEPGLLETVLKEKNGILYCW
jgi:hypothetical protein